MDIWYLEIARFCLPKNAFNDFFFFLIFPEWVPYFLSFFIIKYEVYN